MKKVQQIGCKLFKRKLSKQFGIYVNKINKNCEFIRQEFNWKTVNKCRHTATAASKESIYCTVQCFDPKAFVRQRQMDWEKLGSFFLINLPGITVLKAELNSMKSLLT